MQSASPDSVPPDDGQARSMRHDHVRASADSERANAPSRLTTPAAIPYANTTATPLHPPHIRSAPEMPHAPRDTQPEALPHIMGERRQATVVCLRFSADPHQAGSPEEPNYLLIDKAILRAVEIVYSYEGTIDRFTDNGLIALYGVPTIHENDPERAARAALEIHRALTALGGDDQAGRLHHHIGIHTGQITVSSLADNLDITYTADQAMIAVPMHLQATAPPDTILVSPSTYQYTQLALEYAPVPAYGSNGRHDLSQAFRLVGVASRFNRDLFRQAPLLGRDKQLEQLHQAFEHVRCLRHSEVVLLTGEAGIGKTRLVAEFRGALATAQVVQGTCLAHARAQSLWAIIDLLRDLLGIVDDAPIETQRAAVEAFISRIGLAPDDRLPYLLNVLNLPQADATTERRLRFLEPAILQRQVHTVLRHVLLAAARQMPTVLIFEDLQWIDPASRDFLEYLIGSLGGDALMLVLVARDAEQIDTLEPLLDALEQIPEAQLKLQLQPLNETDAAALVTQLVPRAADAFAAVRTQLVQRTHGNPLYIEEAVRMLIDQQAIVRVGTEWLVTDRVAHVLHTVPGTIQALVLSRFDRLQEQLRRILQKAAVCGVLFPARLLALLGDTSPEVVATQLTELELRQFLIRHHAGLERSCRFCHTMLHEAIYHTLLLSDRRSLHEQVAQVLLSTSFWSSDEQTESLVYHYLASANPMKALPFLVVSAENAARRYANQTAIERYRQAMTIIAEQALPESDLTFRVRLGLGTGLKFVGQFAEARQVLLDVLQPLQAVPETEATRWMLVEVLRELADVRHREGALEEAVTLLEQGLTILEAGGLDVASVQWHMLVERKAFIRFRQGKLDEAFTLASSIAEQVDPQTIDDPATIASLYNTLGGICWQQGQLSNAIAHVERSLDLYQSLSYSFGIANVLTNLGILHYTSGAWSQALDCLQRSDSLRREIGYLVNRAHSIRNLGMLRMAMGDHDGARQDLETSLEISQQLNDDYEIVRALLGLAHLAVVQSRYFDARRQLLLVEQRLEAAGEEEIVMTKWLAGLVAAETGDRLKGQAIVAEALALARVHGLAEQESECQRVLGSILRDTGEYAQAEVQLLNSVQQCQARIDPYQEGLALLELGRLYSRLVEADPAKAPQWRNQARTALDNAAARFVALGAGFDLATTHAARVELGD